MSGGHFNYVNHRIDDIVFAIEQLIVENNYSPETMEKFKEAAATLRRAHIMAHRIDWLVSGDDSEETFHQRWKSKPC
jgi:hypothetical protein